MRNSTFFGGCIPLVPEPQKKNKRRKKNEKNSHFSFFFYFFEALVPRVEVALKPSREKVSLHNTWYSGDGSNAMKEEEMLH